MSEWPPIDAPELVARLCMDDAEFEEFVETLLAAFPARDYGEDVLARALAYPGVRPRGSFLLRDGTVEELDAMDAEERGAVRAAFAADPARHPLLAFGANGSPGGLESKFAHFSAPEDRTALVLCGWLHGFDVGVAAQPTLYLTMPATIFPSPGTAVRAALVWATAAQFTQLVWSEMNYRLGRLGTRFVIDEGEEGEADGASDAGTGGGEHDEVLAFVSRFGALRLDGDGPIALDAVPARGRVAESLTQAEILNAVAALVLGPGADAAALVRAACEDIGAIARRAAGPLRSHSVPFASPLWTPFSAPR